MNFTKYSCADIIKPESFSAEKWELEAGQKDTNQLFIRLFLT